MPSSPQNVCNSIAVAAYIGAPSPEMPAKLTHSYRAVVRENAEFPSPFPLSRPYIFVTKEVLHHIQSIEIERIAPMKHLLFRMEHPTLCAVKSIGQFCIDDSKAAQSMELAKVKNLSKLIIYPIHVKEFNLTSLHALTKYGTTDSRTSRHHSADGIYAVQDTVLEECVRR